MATTPQGQGTRSTAGAKAMRPVRAAWRWLTSMRTALALLF